MKSLYGTTDDEPEPFTEKKVPAPPPPVKPATAAAAGPRSGKKIGVKVLGLINLILLVIIIGFQVKIVFWQTNITTSLKRLENEVNQEKLQRIELGSNLLKKIEEASTQPVPPPAAVSAIYHANQPAAVYAKPNAKSKQITKLKKGQEVTVEEQDGVWRKVSIGSKSGWVNMKYLTKTK